MKGLRNTLMNFTSNGCSILEQAASITKRSKEATGTLKLTESYKRGHVEKLTEFADNNNLWIKGNLPIMKPFA